MPASSLPERIRRRLFLARRPLALTGERAASMRLVLSGLRDFNALMCESAPGGRLLELGGVQAAVNPAIPERALMNGSGTTIEFVAPVVRVG